MDTDRRELKGAAGSVHVEPQVFDLLFYFARHPNRVIGKDELIENVWKGRIVSDAALNSRINSARRAVGETGEKQVLIRTIPRRGFLFAADVKRESHQADALAGVATHVPPLNLALPDKSSIPVLPVQKLRRRPEPEH